jgi:hypothetical protein
MIADVKQGARPTPQGPGDGAEFGDGDLVVRQDLEQQCLGFDVEAVDFVQQQDDGVRRADLGEQRPGEEEFLAGDLATDRLG